MARIKAIQHGFEIIPGSETASSDVSDCGSRSRRRPSGTYCIATAPIPCEQSPIVYPIPVVDHQDIDAAEPRQSELDIL